MKELLPFFSERQVERGVIGYVMSIGVTVGLYSIAVLVSSKVSGLKFRQNFANLVYGYLAVFAIYSIVGSIFGQVASNGGSYITAALHYIGVYLYLPPSLIDIGSSEVYSLKWIPESIISLFVGGYITYRISKNITGNNSKNMIRSALPHIIMILIMILIFSTIEPRWA